MGHNYYCKRDIRKVSAHQHAESIAVVRLTLILILIPIIRIVNSLGAHDCP
jgi:hypothetical protein